MCVSLGVCVCVCVCVGVCVCVCEEGGGWVESVEKRKFMTNLFSDNIEWIFKKL